MMLRAKLVLLGLVVGVIGCGADEALVASSEAEISRQAAVLIEHQGGASFARRVAATTGMVALSATEESAIYVYQEHARGRWTLGAVVHAPEPAEGTAFGMGLALTADRMVVGEPLTADGGRVHLFKKSRAGWVLEATLRTPSVDSIGFGMSVALDGDRLLVGAPSGDAGGAVFAYRRTKIGWVLEQRLVPKVALGYSAFGWSVAARQGIAVVGAPMTYAYVEHWSRGAMYVFELGAAGWQETAAYDEGPVDDGGVFGLHVAIDGGVIVVSCDCPDGEAYVYERVEGAWTLAAVLVADWQQEWTSFSHAVAVSNGHIFVTAPDREGSAERVGTVLRYIRTTAGWVADGAIEAPVDVADLQFGAEIDASGEMVVVAASPFEGVIPLWIFPTAAR